MKQPNEVTNLHLAIETAQEAARKAGAYLIDKQGHVQVHSSKALHDDLLDADLESEAIIIETLRATFPDYGIHSEEAGEDTRDSMYQWLIDPLDGSANFQHGSPTFAVSVGLLEEGNVVVGAIYLPHNDEMFTVIRGEGAKLNGKSIQVSQISKIGKAIIHVGDFAKNGDRGDNGERIEQMRRLTNTVERIRMIGTAATDFAYIACGRADGFVINSFQPWDIEPGRLLVIEAGGKETEFSRKKKQGAIFSNGLIHDDLGNLASNPATQEIQNE